MYCIKLLVTAFDYFILKTPIISADHLNESSFSTGELYYKFIDVQKV